jgi:hypothetical protein
LIRVIDPEWQRNKNYTRREKRFISPGSKDRRQGRSGRQIAVIAQEIAVFFPAFAQPEPRSMNSVPTQAPIKRSPSTDGVLSRA